MIRLTSGLPSTTGASCARVAVSAASKRNTGTFGQSSVRRGAQVCSMRITLGHAGEHLLMVRCTNSNGVAQPATPNWNPAGFMRNVVECTKLVAV